MALFPGFMRPVRTTQKDVYSDSGAAVAGEWRTLRGERVRTLNVFDCSEKSCFAAVLLDRSPRSRSTKPKTKKLQCSSKAWKTRTLNRKL